MRFESIKPKATTGRQMMTASAAAIRAHRDNARHRRIIELYRRQHPACERCGIRATGQIHHIDRVEHGGGTEPSNLLALCVPCHLTIDDVPRDQQRALKDDDVSGHGEPCHFGGE